MDRIRWFPAKKFISPPTAHPQISTCWREIISILCLRLALSKFVKLSFDNRREWYSCKKFFHKYNHFWYIHLIVLWELWYLLSFSPFATFDTLYQLQIWTKLFFRFFFVVRLFILFHYDVRTLTLYCIQKVFLYGL